jgi:hypothetical protein
MNSCNYQFNMQINFGEFHQNYLHKDIEIFQKILCTIFKS